MRLQPSAEWGKGDVEDEGGIEMFSLSCTKKKDSDIIAYLDAQKRGEGTSMNAAMKRAIRAQIAKEA